MEKIHKKKQKIAVEKHEAILDVAKLNHKRELEKKEEEMNEQIKDKEQELLLARQLRHDYEDLEKANENLKSLNENQEKKMDELNNKNEDLKSLNKELRKANETKELKSNKKNKKSIRFEDLENLDKTKEENKKLKVNIIDLKIKLAEDSISRWYMGTALEEQEERLKESEGANFYERNERLEDIKQELDVLGINDDYMKGIEERKKELMKLKRSRQ